MLVLACSGGSNNDDPNTTLVRDDGTTADIGYLLNGESSTDNRSNWICSAVQQGTGEQQTYVFAVWRNGRGNSSAAGAFSWELNGSDVEISPDAGGFSIVGELAHDVARDRIAFIEFQGTGSILRTLCQREFSG